MTDVQPRIAYPISEALSIAEAVDVANKSPRTIRERRYLRDLGRRIGGQRDISRVALAMFLDGDKLALEGYLAGDRTSPTVMDISRVAECLFRGGKITGWAIRGNRNYRNSTGRVNHRSRSSCSRLG